MPLCTTSEGHQVVPLWLNGEPRVPKDARLIPVRSTLTGEVVHQAVSADHDAALAACDASWTAFQSWKRSPPSQRRDVLNRVAEAFERRTKEFVQYQMRETSCDEAWATHNVGLAVNYLREIAACVSSIMGFIPMNDKPDTMSFVFKDPVGVVLTIPPWNAAMVLATRGIASAVGAGCTVLLKASELSPLSHQTIVECFEEGGLPKGCINQVQVAREAAAEITELLIADQRIRKIEFIGSAAVGKVIGGLAAKYLKPVLMELGGKCPAIVLDDANLPKAAMLCAKGGECCLIKFQDPSCRVILMYMIQALLHHGQICFSTERIIVHKNVAEKFQQFLADAVTSHGSAGSAVTPAIAQHAYDVLQDAQSNGSTFLVADGDFDPSSKSKTALKPTIVLNPRGRIVDEETFGPSASLYIVENDQEAIDIANKSAYGLNATIHSQNMERALKMARELEYGQVHVNSISVYVSRE